MRSVMGNTLKKRLSKQEAQELAGKFWDEELFDELAQKDGKVSRKDLVRVMRDLEFQQNLEHTAEEEKEEKYEPLVQIDVEVILANQQVKNDIPMTRRFGSMQWTPETKALLEDIGGGDSILAITDRFYQYMFRDQHLDKFVRSHDDPHAERLATWIVEKMSGNPVWSTMRPPNARQKAHADAWTSPKREPQKHGRRFKLDDCRIWMRLMFLSVRDVGLDRHVPFFNWYVQFIGHFIGVYEFTAPPFAPTDSMWSANNENVQSYLENGRLMRDVIISK